VTSGERAREFENSTLAAHYVDANGEFGTSPRTPHNTLCFCVFQPDTKPQKSNSRDAASLPKKCST
jgi:hypothetical protein